MPREPFVHLAAAGIRFEPQTQTGSVGDGVAGGALEGAGQSIRIPELEADAALALSFRGAPVATQLGQNLLRRDGPRGGLDRG